MEPAYCPSGLRCKGGVNLIQAFARDLGTCRFDDKGETQVEEPTRVRVPMRDTGTEQSVVAEKSRNGDGAKGLRCLPLFAGQPEMGGAS